jgi:hypothetical protein
MEFISKLWLPILLSAVAVWFWAFLSWAVLALHKRDMRPLPNEEAFANAVRALNLPAGVYAFPYCEDHKQHKDPAFQAKWKAGPVGQISIWRPCPNMGANMLMSFLVYLAVSFFIAYAGYAAMPIASHSKAFQVAGAMGIIAYCFAALPVMIWFQALTHTKVMAVIDGIIQGLITGAIFAAMWPGMPSLH